MLQHRRFDSLFVDGGWVRSESEDTISVISPYTEHVVATVPAASHADMDRAVSAARRAFDSGPWPRMTVAQRVEILQRVRNALAERADEIATLVSHEMGCPISLSRTMQAANPRLVLEAYLDLIPDHAWAQIRQSATGRALVAREPIGVVAAIVPWNAPLLTAMGKLVPALLTGCTVVHKPSPETPLSAYLLAEIFADAGMPEGVVNIVPAERDTS